MFDMTWVMGALCREEWLRFEEDYTKASRFRHAASASFAFQYVEGMLLKALKQGYWLFLDEINLAPPETLHCLAAVLEPGPNVSLTLVDRGSVLVPKHPQFRLIGAMNPATDFGKRDLSAPLRNKFTEFWFTEPETREDLEMIVSGYLSQLGPPITASRIVDFYTKVKEESRGGLTDGAGQSPCYSLRTLCRFLEYIQKMAGAYGLQRALMDGAFMTFATQLDSISHCKMAKLIHHYILTEHIDPTVLKRVPQRPRGKRQTVLFEQFWLETGTEDIPEDGCVTGKKFIATPSIAENLKNLARAVVLR